MIHPNQSICMCVQIGLKGRENFIHRFCLFCFLCTFLVKSTQRWDKCVYVGAIRESDRVWSPWMFRGKRERRCTEWEHGPRGNQWEALKRGPCCCSAGLCKRAASQGADKVQLLKQRRYECDATEKHIGHKQARVHGYCHGEFNKNPPL